MIDTGREKARRTIEPAIASLYRHWLRADALKVRLWTPVPTHGDIGLPKQMHGAAQSLSSMMMLESFHALLYVVVEGYRELGLKDAAIDALLGQQHMKPN